MKILITGYKGFIGRNMVDVLKPNHVLYGYEWGEELPNVEEVDLVMHLGAISATTETDVEKILNQNYDFSCWLLSECQKHGKHFQFSSSASIYGLGNEFNEDSPPKPASPYAWTKYLFERYVKKGEGTWTIPVQGFRYFNVHGPQEGHKGDQASPYHKFTQQAKETGVIKLFENSNQYKRDFVPVSYVVDIHQQFFNVKESGIWNIGLGRAKSFQEVAEEVAAEHNAKIEYIPMPENIAKQYQKYTCADLTKLNRTLVGE